MPLEMTKNARNETRLVWCGKNYLGKRCRRKPRVIIDKNNQRLHQVLCRAVQKCLSHFGQILSFGGLFGKKRPLRDAESCCCSGQLHARAYAQPHWNRTATSLQPRCSCTTTASRPRNHWTVVWAMSCAAAMPTNSLIMYHFPKADTFARGELRCSKLSRWKMRVQS